MSVYMPIPNVVETDGRTERSWDVFSRLLKDRIIFIGSFIDDYVANGVIAQLLYLQMEDAKKDIHVYINSPGGSVTDGMAIYDTINFLRCDVVTYCIGLAASLGTVLLSAGTAGKRHALPNSRIMIHQPTGGATGQTSDISIAAKEILRWKQTINNILSKHTGKSIKQIEKDSDRDYYMTAEEAKMYGIVDHVIAHKKDIVS
jgi:ATP-dependent Clp protease, protease subunit